MNSSGTASKERSTGLARARAREVEIGASELIRRVGPAPKATLIAGTERLLTEAAAGERISISRVQHGIFSING
jgi:hypothetical protein